MSPPLPRRGSAYVFVLGVTLIVTVMGMGALTLSRVSGRAAVEGNDWETAGTLAFSATEHALSVVNAAAAAGPSTWRSGYTSGQTAFTQAVGRGLFAWALVDETDGNLSGDYLHPVRVYGVGRVGTVTRVYSVKLTPGGSPLPVLRTAVHSTGIIKLTGNGRALNGPISSNDTVQLSGTVNGAIEANKTSGNAQGTQTPTVPAPAKVVPGGGILSVVGDRTTLLDYATTGATISKKLFAPGVNPYGAGNAEGLYGFNLPSGANLTITQCRVVGTLLIYGAGNNKITFDGPNLFETGPSRTPILLLSSPGGTFTIDGSQAWLTESAAGVNFNPAAVPFAGSSDTDKTDDFPPQYRGLIHVMGGSTGSVMLTGNSYLVGTLMADCPVQTKDQCTLVQDPSLYANPPFGYATGDAMVEVPGSWRWDTLPAGMTVPTPTSPTSPAGPVTPSPDRRM